MNSNEYNLALQVLCDAEWLRDYPAEVAQNLLAEGRLVHLNVGEWAQAEGDARNGLFVVIDGLLHSYCTALEDRLIMIGLSAPGSVVGHSTRYSGGPRLVTAVCAEPSILLEISESALDRVAIESPEIWRAIAAFAYIHMRNALRMAAEVIALRPRQRIAARLLATASFNDNGDTPTVKISQELLAEMTGVTRKTVNGYLSAYERDGLIQLGYGSIKLCDINRLQLIANG